MTSRVKTNMGRATAIRFTGELFLGKPGWQVTDSKGNLSVLIFHDGRISDPFDRGNASWELCEVSDDHREVLQFAVNLTRTEDSPFTAEGVEPTVIKGL